MTATAPRGRVLALVAIQLLAACGRAHADGYDRAAQLEAAVATITVDELREHTGLLADDTLEGREAGKRGGIAAARYIENQLKAAGLQPAGDNGGYLQRFNPGYQNVIAMLPGTDPALRGEHILIGAHYDHVGYGTWRNSNGPTGYIHNGADDNASGVAALLELVDALHRTQWQPRRSILIAFWDGEEINLLGSRHWVRQPTVPLESVRLAVNVDMVGRMCEGRLEVGGAHTGAGLRQLLSTPSLPADMWIDFSWEYKENSDHWPLFLAGVPSILMHTGLHDDYHTPRDDVEKLNLPGIRLASAYILETVCRAADAETLPAFRPASRTENESTPRQRQAALPPAEPRLGLTWDWADEEVAGPRMTIATIARGSAAEAAGLQVGDRIVAVDGMAINDEVHLPAAVLQAPETLTLAIARGDAEPVDVVVTLTGEPTKLGLSWREDNAEPGAVFITRVVPYSPAARAGMKVRDRIYSVSGEPFATSDALLARVQELLAADSAQLQFEVETAGRIRSVNVDLRLPTAGTGDATL